MRLSTHSGSLRSRPDSGGAIHALCTTLRRAGCELDEELRPGGLYSGLSLALSVRDLLGSPADLEALAGTINASLARRAAVTLTFTDLYGADEPASAFEELCRRLRRAGVGASDAIGTCLAEPAMALRAYALISRCYLGNGPRYVMTQRCHGKRLSDEDWDYIWRHRDNCWAVWPAYGDAIATHCPLLSDESANAVLAPDGLHAPASSVWLPVRLNLSRFAAANGDIHLDALDRALHASVDCGEQIIDELLSQGRLAGDDVRRNRRLAITVSGIGDIVSARGGRPCDLATLESCMQLATYIRTTLWQRSKQIAQVSELLPAIRQAQPLPDAEHANCPWSLRWRAAVERTAVRHRNLLVMSPYTVLPAAGGDCAAYADLLPVIGLADAHAFADPPAFVESNLLNFKRFHCRAKAVIRRRADTSVVATRV